MIYTSSVDAVITYDAMVNVTEEAPYAGVNEYCWTKAEAERRVLAANRRKKLRTCALRPSLVYGEIILACCLVSNG